MRLDALPEHAKLARRTRDDGRAPRIAPRSADAEMVASCPLPHDDASSWRALLDRYLAGWAEADPIKIFEATAPGYRLDDPLVGLFTRWSVAQYFDLLRARFGAAGTIVPGDLGFILRGPMDHSSSRLGLQFCREAPRIGLTGIAAIKVGERGVIADSVAYDLNLASDLLRRAK
jgi:hypothetical protein